MRRGLRGVARRAAVLLLALAACEGARAADISHYDPIGFSEDGRVFAFGEWGIQDGSGAPYVTVSAIDTESDTFLSGTPIRLHAGEPGDLTPREMHRMVHAMRARAHGLLEAATADIVFMRGNLQTLAPVTDLTREGRRLLVKPYPTVELIGRPIVLELTPVRFERGLNGCPDFAGPVSGFALTLSAESGPPHVMHRDDHVPRSRGCALDYHLAGVETHHTHDTTTIVALVQVLSLGFEGHDARWMAVARRIPRGR